MRVLRTSLLCTALAAGLAEAQDLLSLAAIEALPGTTRPVPIAILDRSGTTLDEGAGANLEIQGFAFRVDFSPAAAISTVGFVQTGITVGKTPVFPIVTIAADHVVVLINFDEQTDGLAFSLDAAPPGNVVGELRFAIAPEAELGTTITLSLDEANATLVNDAATFSESVANGQLALGHGEIYLDAEIFADGFASGDLSAWSSNVGG